MYAILTCIELDSTGDWVIEESEKAPGFINCGGIDSPGLTSSPAIALRVVGILKNIGACTYPQGVKVLLHKAARWSLIQRSTRIDALF